MMELQGKDSFEATGGDIFMICKGKADEKDRKWYGDLGRVDEKAQINQIRDETSSGVRVGEYEGTIILPEDGSQKLLEH